MSSFSPTDAAFSVFPLVKRYPRFVGLVLAVSVPIGIISSVLFTMGLGEAFADYSQRVARNPSLSADDISAIGALVNTPIALLMLVFGVVANSVLAGLILRKTVLNEDPVGIGIKFASLEVRLIQANLALFGIMFVASVLVFSILGLLAGLAGAGTGAALFVAVLAPVCLILLSIVAVGRLGLFGVAAAATGTLGLKAAWNISRGSFWSIVGALLLWSIAATVMTMLFQALVSLTLGVSAETGGLATSPLGIVASGLLAAFGGFTQLGTICVGAYAWHQMQANAPQSGWGSA